MRRFVVSSGAGIAYLRALVLTMRPYVVRCTPGAKRICEVLPQDAAVASDVRSTCLTHGNGKCYVAKHRAEGCCHVKDALASFLDHQGGRRCGILQYAFWLKVHKRDTVDAAVSMHMIR